MKRYLLSLALSLCLLAGCAQSPAPDTPGISDTPVEHDPPAPPRSPVYTDWSKLTPYEPMEPLYSCSDNYCGSGPLHAWDGYGTLLPYVGANLAVENYITDRLPVFGLANTRGEIVTDAVYAGISTLDGFMMLYRGTGELYRQGDIVREQGAFDLTVAAPDGSWVRDAAGYYYANSWADGGGLLALGSQDGGFEFWNAAGETVAVFPAEMFRPYLGSSFVWSAEGGPWAEWWYDGLIYVQSYDYLGQNGDALRLYLDLSTGRILEEAPDGYPAEPVYGNSYDIPDFPGYISVWPMEDPITGRVYYKGYREGGACHLLDGDGNIVWEDYDDLDAGFSTVMDGRVASWPGYYEISAETSWFSWYELESGECVFRYPVSDNSD